MDDVYPNDGSFYQPPVPEEVKEERQEDQQKVQSAKPYIEDEIKWFEEQIALASSTTNLRNTIKEFPELKLTTDQALVIHEVIVKIFEVKKEQLVSDMAELERS